MNTDNRLQAILLLCSFFNKNESRNIKPLTPTEYSRLAVWLHQNQYRPEDFLSKDNDLLKNWQDPKNKITTERLSGLLQRAASMGFALEKWQQQNVWILSRASQEYPKVLKDKLGDTRSPLLYCIGNNALLSTPGIGFVGSRDTNVDDDRFTQSLAQQAVEQGFTVVSGGAKGVDQTSMLAALDSGGSAIGILADSLLKSATKPQYRTALQEGRLLLLTPYYPEAGFSPGNAMGRNKYIYSLSKGVVVAKSDIKGGTWSGATENLKKQWVPLWVRDIEQSGNQKLIESGGQSLSESTVDFNQLQSSFTFSSAVVTKSTSSKASKASKQIDEPKPETQADSFTPDLFSGSTPEVIDESPKTKEATDVTGSISTHETVLKTDNAKEAESLEDQDRIEEIPELSQQLSNGIFLDVFYLQLQLEQDKVHTPKALTEKYPELSEAIIKQWLKMLEEQGLIKREGRKLAYTLIKKK
jgi:DNA processing protein